jgi:hypothetical protein
LKKLEYLYLNGNPKLRGHGALKTLLEGELPNCTWYMDDPSSHANTVPFMKAFVETVVEDYFRGAIETRSSGVSTQTSEAAHALILRVQDANISHQRKEDYKRILHAVKHARENDNARRQNNPFFTNDPNDDEGRAKAELGRIANALN